MSSSSDCMSKMSMDDQILNSEFNFDEYYAENYNNGNFEEKGYNNII